MSELTGNRIRTTADKLGLPHLAETINKYIRRAEEAKMGYLILTSDKTFSEWGQVFGDDVLATTILNRLLHHCEVISINGPSYRLKNRLQAIERENEVA